MSLSEGYPEDRLDSHDCIKIWDTTRKGNFWTFGYNHNHVMYIYKTAHMFAKLIDVSIDTVRFEEIMKSDSCKGFLYMYSESNEQKPYEGSFHSDDYRKMFRMN